MRASITMPKCIGASLDVLLDATAGEAAEVRVAAWGGDVRERGLVPNGASVSLAPSPHNASTQFASTFNIFSPPY